MSNRTADSSSILHRSASSRSGGDGQSPLRVSPASSKKTLDWMPLQKHPLFNNAIVAAPGTAPSPSSVLRNLLAWDVSSSRLYLWEAASKCVHRLAVRFRDPDPVSSPTSSSSIFVEAAVPSEILLTDNEIQATVHHISLNTDGSTLLLYGSEGLAAMYLFERTRTIDDKIYCRTVLLGSSLFSIHNNGLRILQASWHPYSSNHLGVLSSDSVLRLFDLSSDLERAEQEFYLQPENRRNQNTVSFCPIAFSFGVNHLWERFSIFLLYSNASLYILCPVVPFGSLCSWTHIEEIYNDAHVCILDSSDARVSRNSGLAITWLEATFPKLVDRKMEGGNVIVLRAHSYAPLDASLALQGPLASVSSREKDETYVSSTYYEGKLVNFMYNSIGKDSVFIIAWSNGLLEIYALADEIQPLWNVGNSPHLSLDATGNIESVAMICQSDLEEISAEHEFKKIHGASAAVYYRHLPPLLKISIVDLQLPKDASNGCLLSLFPDPLVSNRFYCIHAGGMDMIILHALPFSDIIPEKDTVTSSVCPILLTPHLESPPPVLCGYVIVTDSYGHSQFLGVTPTYECLVLDMKGWSDEMLPSHFDLDVKPAGSTEASIPEILSKELISGPKAIVIPSSTSLRSLTPDSIEGRSTLHHYVKLFHENYVEYAHKVYIELEHHGEHVKSIIDSQLKRLKDVEQSLSKLENDENGVKGRINRAFKVYELLDQRLQNFKALPVANKKPLSKAEREFNAELDRIANHELDSLDSSIDALNTRLRRFLQSSSNSFPNTGRAAPGRRKYYVPDDQVLKLKSSLDLLSNLNSENTKKVKFIEDILNKESQTILSD